MPAVGTANIIITLTTILRNLLPAFPFPVRTAQLDDGNWCGSFHLTKS
jgi:hypothetical protein